MLVSGVQSNDLISVYCERITVSLDQWSPTFLATGTNFPEDSISSTEGMGLGGVQAVMRVLGSGRSSFVSSRTTHLLLCDPVPNKPQ